MTKTPTTPLNQTAFEQLFTDARTYNAWSDRTVLDEQLKNLYDYVKYGPTSANCCPARFIFVTSDKAKEKLKPALDGSNVEKTMSAPATVIIAMDNEFYEELPKLFPHADAKSWFDSDEEKAKDAAFRNSTLQGGYLIMAARALGLDCGPMSGFDKDKVKDAFFPDKNWTANFLCNLGYGTEENLFPRSPRLKFDEACEIV